jgi:hypothetical protein
MQSLQPVALVSQFARSPFVASESFTATYEYPCQHVPFAPGAVTQPLETTSKLVPQGPVQLPFSHV